MYHIPMADSFGIGWRNESYSGGAFKHIRVAAWIGILSMTTSHLPVRLPTALERTLCFIPPFRDLFSLVIYNRLRTGCCLTQSQFSKINSCIGTGCFRSMNPYRECPEASGDRPGYRGSYRHRSFPVSPIWSGPGIDPPRGCCKAAYSVFAKDC